MTEWERWAQLIEIFDPKPHLYLISLKIELIDVTLQAARIENLLKIKVLSFSNNRPTEFLATSSPPPLSGPSRSEKNRSE